ncbi:MAG TPA: SRPBCC family protein [Aquihabitans sp.]|jgi:carbon monoxide dehydrogenase subunit G|nr:SRPBCC family protein [Aquihabitans sp.]
MAEVVPQGIEFADTAPSTAEGSAVVDGTPAEVWAVLLDHPAWPRWFAGIRSCRATSDPPTGVGSTREVVLTGGPTFQERFVAWDEDALWAFTAVGMRPSIFRSLVERVTIVEEQPGRTRVTYRMAFEGNGPVRLAAPLLVRALGRNLAKAMRSLGREVAARR